MATKPRCALDVVPQGTYNGTPRTISRVRARDPESLVPRCVVKTRCITNAQWVPFRGFDTLMSSFSPFFLLKENRADDDSKGNHISLVASGTPRLASWAPLMDSKLSSLLIQLGNDI